MKITTPDGREFIFGDNVDPHEANALVRNLLDKEQELAGLLAAGEDKFSSKASVLAHDIVMAKLAVEEYAKTTQADYRAPAYRPPEPSGPTMTAGEAAIVAELQQIRLATLADKEIVPNPLTGEMTRSRVVLENSNE